MKNVFKNPMKVIVVGMLVAMTMSLFVNTPNPSMDQGVPFNPISLTNLVSIAVADGECQANCNCCTADTDASCTCCNGGCSAGLYTCSCS